MVYSVFEVVDFKTKEHWRETKKGYGQEAIRDLRKEYPKFSKIVLVGFEIKDKFVAVNF